MAGSFRVPQFEKTRRRQDNTYKIVPGASGEPCSPNTAVDPLLALSSYPMLVTCIERVVVVKCTKLPVKTLSFFPGAQSAGFSSCLSAQYLCQLPLPRPACLLYQPTAGTMSNTFPSLPPPKCHPNETRTQKNRFGSRAHVFIHAPSASFASRSAFFMFHDTSNGMHPLSPSR